MKEWSFNSIRCKSKKLMNNNFSGFHGVRYRGKNHCIFSVWAPLKKSMTLHLLNGNRSVGMEKNSDGYFVIELDNIPPGTKYFYMPDGEKKLPDPASMFQPEGVHGPSQVIDHSSFHWEDGNWKGLPFRDLILYELHVGTFTPEGTFEAIISRLDDLKETGINAIEIMPVAQFPGGRNWGYDGTFPYAVQNTYGGPEGFKKLVNACHQKGIAVFLDVVYNHIGPEGNYFSQFGPYFNHNYNTPWGDAINFDNNYADGVREYFCKNALYWLEYFHCDGLRLDAIHAIFDMGAKHFLQYVNDEVKLLQQRVGRSLHLIAESDLNSPRVINDRSVGGYGFDAQWLDDFHHALYTLVNPKDRARYADFGSITQLAKAYKEGFVHSGEYVNFRKRKYGASSAGIDGNRFVAFILNHDQAGNRVHGERLCMLVDPQRIKLAAAGLLLSPYVPMLFMGEEYAEDAPFFYFVSHSDKELIEAVRKGRKEEFKEFAGQGEPEDAASEETFRASIIKWDKRKSGHYAEILSWHKSLIELRRTHPALKNFEKDSIQTHVIDDQAIAVHRNDVHGKNPFIFCLNFSEQYVDYKVPGEVRYWNKILDSSGAGNTNGNSAEVVLQAEESVKLPPLSVIIFVEKK
jgi:maltooligosyltrehalose trehalohydrolase